MGTVICCVFIGDYLSACCLDALIVLGFFLYVIPFPCISVKDASCVDVCPVDCIHSVPAEPGFAEAEQLYINPDECIDCGACEPVCPVSAIFEESAVPDKWKQFIHINADFYRSS